MIDLSKMNQDEWLEADGLGGFASGTVSGIRTRRYHALLLAATNPPAGRIVLVNGFDASVETASGSYSLTSQLYSPDVIHPDGARRITEFKTDPWPQWIYTLEDGTQIQQEIFALHGAAIVCLSWQVVKNASKTMLSLRPFLSGRDYHSMHHENPAFQFHPQSMTNEPSGAPILVFPQSSRCTMGNTVTSPIGIAILSTSRSGRAVWTLARISRRPEHFAGILAPGKLYGSWPPKVMRIVK